MLKRPSIVGNIINDERLINFLVYCKSNILSSWHLAKTGKSTADNVFVQVDDTRDGKL